MTTIFGRLSCSRGALALLLACVATTAWSQSPFFPNTTPAYYGPYGTGAYGRYGSNNNLPSAFRNNQPSFIRPTSALQFNYRTNTPGFYNSPYIYNGNNNANNNNNSGGYFYPFGY